MVIRFVLHPGSFSTNGSPEKRVIDARTLARLCGVRLADCVLGDVEEYVERVADVHLRPQPDGRYGLPVLADSWPRHH